MQKLAILTVGQTPREDILQDLKSYLPEGYLLTEYGVLDGLTREEADRRYGYRGEGALLISRMRDQGPVLLDGDKAAQGMQLCIDRAEQAGVDLLMMACTGHFSELRHKIPLIMPGAVQRSKTIQLARGGAIGVIFPNKDQRVQVIGWWKDSGVQVELLEPASPYSGDEEVVEAALRLKAAGAKVLCMDCFGYSAAQKKAVCQAAGLETVLPREGLAELAVEILDGAANLRAAVSG